MAECRHDWVWSNDFDGAIAPICYCRHCGLTREMYEEDLYWAEQAENPANFGCCDE